MFYIFHTNCGVNWNIALFICYIFNVIYKLIKSSTMQYLCHWNGDNSFGLTFHHGSEETNVNLIIILQNHII